MVNNMRAASSYYDQKYSKYSKLAIKICSLPLAIVNEHSLNITPKRENASIEKMKKKQQH